MDEWCGEERSAGFNFFPEIDAMNKFAKALENKGYIRPVTVHSADELRKEKVEWLRKGKSNCY